MKRPTTRDSQVRRTKSLRLGLGEYEALNSEDATTSLQELRSLFLNIASKIKPELAFELADLLSLYGQIPLFCYTASKKRRNTAGGGKRFSWSRHCRPKWRYIEEAWRIHVEETQKRTSQEKPFKLKFDQYYDVSGGEGLWLSHFNMPPHDDPKIAAFIQRLFEWSTRHGLDAPWCREQAYETLDLWSQSEEYKGAKVWWYTTAHVSSLGRGKGRDKVVMFLRAFEARPDMGKLQFTWHTLFPVQGFRAEVRQSIMNAFQEQLDAFLDQREQQAQDTNLVRSTRKNSTEHLKWLAYFQLKKMDYKQISISENTSKNANQHVYVNDETKKVRKAINDLAKKIKLPLREEATRPGRRPKTIKN